jgi:hypothetical protein
MMFESKSPRRTFGANKGEMGNYTRENFVIYTDDLIRTVKYRWLGRASNVVRFGRKET